MRKLKNFLRKWWECRTKRCSYYRHYLVYGPAEMPHEAFHFAEESCEYWQLRDMEWCKAHEIHHEWGTVEYTGGESPYRHLCEVWEKRVRA